MQASLTLLATPRSTAWQQPPGWEIGAPLPLVLRHPQRWHRQDVTRVILGSDPDWADVLLIDNPLTIQREHARFYLNHAVPSLSDFRAMKNCPVLINGHPHPPLEWVAPASSV